MRELRQPEFTNYPIPTLLRDRRNEINVFRLRIGHAGVKEYLYRTKQSDTDLCACGAVETIYHYLLDCGTYDQERIKMCKAIANIISPILILTEKLLLGLNNYNRRHNLQILRSLTNFIKDTGRTKEI